MRINNHIIAKDLGEFKIAIEFAPVIENYCDSGEPAPGDLFADVEPVWENFPDNKIMISFFVVNKNGEYYEEPDGFQYLFNTLNEAVDYVNAILLKDAV